MTYLITSILIVSILYLQRRRHMKKEAPERLIEYAVSLEQLLNPKYKTNRRYDSDGMEAPDEVGLSFPSLFDSFDEVRIWINEEYLPNIVKAACRIAGPHSKVIFSIDLEQLLINGGCVEFNPEIHALFINWVSLDENANLINNRKLINEELINY